MVIGMSSAKQELEIIAIEMFEKQQNNIKKTINKLVLGLKSEDPIKKYNATRSITKSIQSVDLDDIELNPVFNREMIANMFFEARNFDSHISYFDTLDEIDKILHPRYRDMFIEIAFEPIIQALNDKTLKIQMLWCLKYLDDPRAVGPLISLLKESTGEEKLLLDLFIRFKDESIAPILNLQDSDNKFVRRFVARYIGEIRNEDSLDVLIKFLDDKDWNVRFKSIVALGQIGGEQSMDVLMRSTEDKSKNVRRKATEVIGILASGERILTFEEFLQNQNEQSINY
jgi:HEAT repeat protein